MRNTFHFLGASSLLVKALAQDFTQLSHATPQCALPCVLGGIEKFNCNLTESSLEKCLCPNTPMQMELSICVQRACSFQDQVLAVNVETELCESYPQESRSAEIRIFAIVLSAITFPLVISRCWSRWVVSRRIWWDDGAAIAATMFLIVLGATEIFSAELGLGKHYWQISLSEGTLILKLYYVAQIMYILVQDFAKISILLLYHRVFARPWFKLTTKVFIAFIATHGFVFILVVIFQCIPIYSIWDRTITAKCVNLAAVGYAGAVLSIVEDLAILFLPVSELGTLNLGVRKTVSLMVMFSIGSFACIASMVRMKYVASLGSSFDSTWDNVDVVIWSMLELYSALICACLPSLRPLLVRYLPDVFKITTNSGQPPGGIAYQMQNWKKSTRKNGDFLGLSGHPMNGQLFRGESV